MNGRRLVIGLSSTRGAAYWVARLWFRGLFYGHSLRGRRPSALTFIPEENWPGSAERGALLVGEQLRFRNHTVNAQDAASGSASPGEVWLTEYHGFGWLRDLRAVGTENARIRARTYVSDWIAHNSRWQPLGWRPDILAARLCNWPPQA